MRVLKENESVEMAVLKWKFERYWTISNYVSLPHLYVMKTSHSMMIMMIMMSWPKYQIIICDFVCWDLFLPPP